MPNLRQAQSIPFFSPFFTARFGLRDYGRRVRSDLQKNGGIEKQTVRVVISTWMLLSNRMAYWGASRVMQGRQLKRLGEDVGEVEKDIHGKNGREVEEVESDDVDEESDTEMVGTMALTGGLLITVLLTIVGRSGREEMGREMAETSEMSSIAWKEEEL